MKNRMARFFLILSIVVVFAGCSSAPSVKRVDAGTQTDLSGYWNDTDVRIVCETLINDCLASPRVAQFEKTKGKLPVVIVGNFRNDSDEHIDTSIITKKMETAILNSGKADFVASKDERSEIRDERQQQQGWASEDSAKALANETGADFIMTGSVKTIVDKAGGTATRTYFVYSELTDVETNKKLWIGENSSIKKVIKTPSAKF
jgi:penicillin-binding protein activator